MSIAIGNAIKRSLLSSLTHNLKYLSTSTHLRQTSESSAYAGLGRTTVKVINNDDSHLNIVNSYSSSGFRLANNIYISGSIILFPTHVFSWSVKKGRDITPESLRVFDLIVPKVKIVVVGYGSEDEPYDASIPHYLKQRGISCELLPTCRALTTYNFLVSDAVHVAGAFVTYNKTVSSTPTDNERLFGLEDIEEDKTTRLDNRGKDTGEYYQQYVRRIKDGEEPKMWFRQSSKRFIILDIVIV